MTPLPEGTQTRELLLLYEGRPQTIPVLEAVP